MVEKRQFRAIKGVRDILPPDTALWNWFEATARRVLQSYGYREIRLPVFEETELFARSVGADTDIVSKEMYTFQDRNKSSVALRPEATASVLRAYIEHGLYTQPGLVQPYYVGPMFRRERPQKGRYRQFYQIGAEVLGQSDHPAIDAELIELLVDLLGDCGIPKWTLLINSIGCKRCRPKFVEALRAALAGVKARMCPDCQRRMETNPLRVLDCKVASDQPIIAKLPTIAEYLCPDCREHFDLVLRQLALREIPYTVAPRLVRGLDYYMRTTFEITSPALGAQNALVGGGRYDGLAELLGGPPTKGIGFALGEDRFIEAIRHAGKVQAAARVDVFLAWLGAESSAAYTTAVKLARKIRAAGFSVELPPEEMKLKKSLSMADRMGARYALIVGENEVAAGRYALKRLADAHQRELSEEEILKTLSESD